MSRTATPVRRHDGVYAACLALVLAAGVLGVLLLNTSMQQQAQAVARSHERLAELTGQAQRLQTALDLASDPARLAAEARALRLRPVQRLVFVRPGVRQDRVGKVSARRPGAGRAHAG